MGVVGLVLKQFISLLKRQPRQYLFDGKLMSNQWVFWLIVVGLALVVTSHIVPFWFDIVNKILLVIGIVFILIGVFRLMSMEWLPVLEVPEMGFKAERKANKIRRNFTPDLLVNHLSLGQHFQKGYKLPIVYSYVSPDLNSGWIKIENLGVASKLDRDALKTDISGAVLLGSLSKYVIEDSYFDNDKRWLTFNFENVDVDHNFYVKNNNYKPFVSENPHVIQLNDRLAWTDVHLMIVGTSGSGKSKMIEYILNVADLQGWEISFNSGKSDVLTKKYAGRWSGKSDVEEIVKVAEHYVQVMERRLKQIEKANVDSYEDTNLRNVLVVFDELLDVNSTLDKDQSKRWNAAIKKLSGKSRSAGLRLIIASQHGTVTGLVGTDARVNFQNAIILGRSANDGSQRQFVMPGYELENAKYGKGEGLAYFPNSEFYAEPKRYTTPWIE